MAGAATEIPTFFQSPVRISLFQFLTPQQPSEDHDLGLSYKQSFSIAKKTYVQALEAFLLLPHEEEEKEEEEEER